MCTSTISLSGVGDQMLDLNITLQKPLLLVVGFILSISVPETVSKIVSQVLRGQEWRHMIILGIIFSDYHL